MFRWPTPIRRNSATLELDHPSRLSDKRDWFNAIVIGYMWTAKMFRMFD
jgi:hypothetical protein